MKLIFDLAQKQIRIEGDGPEVVTLFQLVREIAPTFPEITIVAEPSPSYVETAPLIRPEAEKVSGTPRWQTMREFARSLAPANLAEKIVGIGYYAVRRDNRPTFSGKDMGEWFTLCGFEKPAQMAVALFDAKRKYGYIEKAGHNDWRLTPAGENVVIRKLEGNGTEM